MADHLLHLIEITEEGYAHFRMSCAHPNEDETIPEKWQTIAYDGEPHPADGCWFYSWWDACGQELLGHLKVRDPRFPLPVRPSDDWESENGGTIVLDGETYPNRKGRLMDAEIRPLDHGMVYVYNGAPVVDAGSDEGMLREAHDLLNWARFDSMPMRWVAADLVERIAAKFPTSADVIDGAHPKVTAE